MSSKAKRMAMAREAKSRKARRLGRKEGRRQEERRAEIPGIDWSNTSRG